MNKVRILSLVVLSVFAVSISAMDISGAFEKAQQKRNTPSLFTAHRYFLSRLRNYVPSTQNLKAAAQQLVPSARTIEDVLGQAALATGFSWLLDRRSINMLNGHSPLGIWYWSRYYLAWRNGGNYILDNSRCYQSLETSQYARLEKRMENGGQELKPRWSSIHACTATAASIGSVFLFPEMVKMAGMSSFLNKTGSFLARASKEPGAKGIAVLFGLNCATTLCSLATKIALEKYVINPLIKPLLIRFACDLKDKQYDPKHEAMQI